MAQGLKVGDRVRVAERWTDLIGREFVIEELGLSGETARFPGPRPRFIHFNALEKMDPEPKFQVGDEVELDWVQHSTYRILGRAAELDHKDASYDWRLLNLRTGTRVNALESELTKAKAGSKFKVGDRVLDHKYSKQVVTVVATDAHPSWPIRARYADGSLGLWRESELTKIEPVPFKLERGDKVVNIKTGREGEVIRGMVYDVDISIANLGPGVPAAAIEEYEDHYPGTYDLIKGAPW